MAGAITIERLADELAFCLRNMINNHGRPQRGHYDPQDGSLFEAHRADFDRATHILSTYDEYNKLHKRKPSRAALLPK